MSDSSAELRPPNETAVAVERIAQSTYRTLAQEHNLASPPDLKSSLFVGYSEEQMLNVLGQLGATVEGGLQTACVVTINQDPYEQLIWIDSSFPAIAGLKNYTDYGFDKHKLGYSIVAEEVSHFLYKENYFKKHDQEAPDWMSEMIGALDKHNLFEKMSTIRNRRPMNATEAQEAEKIIYTSLNSPETSGGHSKGHTEAKRVADKLNQLVNDDKKEAASYLFDRLYNSNEEEATTLLQAI